LTSLPLWGVVATDCANVWGLIVLGSFGPTYIKNMLGMDIRLAGILSALPMLCRYLGGVFTAFMADKYHRSNVNFP